MANDVWVYIEHKDGETTSMSFELLGIGKTLANDLGSGLCAFVIGENVENIAKEAFQCGASKVYAVEGAIFKAFNAELTQRRQASSSASINRKLPFSGPRVRARTWQRQARHISVSGSARTVSASGRTADK